jgi:hypothetical protein
MRTNIGVLARIGPAPTILSVKPSVGSAATGSQRAALLAYLKKW